MLNSRYVIVLLILIIFTGVTALQVAAEIPQQMSYQGRLTDGSGAPVDDDTYTIRFVIHEEIVADTPLWEDIQNVLVINGIFNTLLPADPVANPFTEPVRFGRYLGITVGADPEMFPRQPLASTLFSFLSGLSEDTEQLHGNTLSDLDNRYVNEGETEIINSDMIEDGSITAGDLSDSYMPASGGTMSGGLTVQGSLAIGAHVSRPYYNILGTGTPVSGFINNEYDLFIADDLEVAGNVFAYENLYVGTDDSADDDYIYFDSTNEFIRWEEDLDDNLSNGNNGGFYLSDDIEVVGNIGIGTPTPTESLHLDMGGSGARSFLKIESSHLSNWGEAGLRIETPQNMWHLRMDDDSNNNIGVGALALRSQNNGSEVMVWQESGSVGIGTTNPGSRLEVRGNGADWETGFIFLKNTDNDAGIRLYDSDATPRHHIYNRNTAGDILRITPSNSSSYEGGITVNQSGYVGIGTITPNNHLDVAGTIRAEEIIVESGWADYVFEKDYTPMSLLEVEKFINKNGHLPNIPTEEEVLEYGVELGAFQVKLLQKVEEITLYLIEQNKQNEEQQRIITQLRKELVELRQDL